MSYVDEYYENYPPISVLSETFRYDGDSGVIVRLKSFHERFIGDEAGGLTKEGYNRVSLCGVEMRAHVLGWILYHGRMPTKGCTIDHVNGDKVDNRIENLREYTPLEQSLNHPEHRNGKLGGCTFDKDKGLWVAKLSVSGAARKRKDIFLGYYNSEEEASARYYEAIKDREACAVDADRRAKERKQEHQSGVEGVKWSKFHEKWTVSVSIERKNHHCGYYESILEAKKIFNAINPIKHDFVVWVEEERQRTGKKSVHNAVHRFLRSTEHGGGCEINSL